MFFKRKNILVLCCVHAYMRWLMVIIMDKGFLKREKYFQGIFYNNHDELNAMLCPFFSGFCYNVFENGLLSVFIFRLEIFFLFYLAFQSSSSDYELLFWFLRRGFKNSLVLVLCVYVKKIVQKKKKKILFYFSYFFTLVHFSLIEDAAKFLCISFTIFF